MKLSNTPERAGRVAPANSEEAQAGTSGEGFRGQGSADNQDSAGSTASRLQKEFATARAHAARVGCSLYELSSGGYLVSRWGWAREVPDLRAVGDMLRRIGAAV
ncbi:MAG: hypothetical protein KGL43_24835 [Burkholderiales bacterium]|nr:hypothetical protein [Burkholderiales bacterium]MDE2395460.1 hypothetical protein [Burkholderiales bacterium]MDE2456828.1 hypothetical protein [Burkholderiales bacterium]